MSTTAITQTLNDKSAEMFRLLTPHLATPVIQRIQAFAVKQTGKRLTDYLAGDATEDEKFALIDEITTIVTNNEWNKLPSIAKGQADERPANGKKPDAAPAAPAPAKKPLVAAPKPAPAAATLVNVATIKGPAAEPATPTPAPVAEDEAEGDPIEIAIAALRAAKQSSANAAKGLTEADVRCIVRSELANVFAVIAEVLNKK